MIMAQLMRSSSEGTFFQQHAGVKKGSIESALFCGISGRRLHMYAGRAGSGTAGLPGMKRM